MKKLLCLLLINCFVLGGCENSEPSSGEVLSYEEEVEELGTGVYTEDDALNIAKNYDKKFSKYISENGLDINYKGYEINKNEEYNSYYITSEFEKSSDKSYFVDINIFENNSPLISFSEGLEEERLFTEGEVQTFMDISKCLISLYSSDVDTVFSELTTATDNSNYSNHYYGDETRYKLGLTNSELAYEGDLSQTYFYLSIIPTEIREAVHKSELESMKVEAVDTTLCTPNDKAKDSLFKKNLVIYHINGSLKDIKQESDEIAYTMLNSKEGYSCEAVIYDCDVYNKDFSEYKDFYGIFNIYELFNHDSTTFFIYGME